MRFTLTINCNGAAFAPNPDGKDPDDNYARDLELARILASVSGQLQDGPTFHARTIRDSNGNTVGEWSLSDHTQPDLLA